MGDAAWVREQLCAPPSIEADGWAMQGANEVKVLPKLHHSTPVYKSIHKAGTSSIEYNLRVGGRRQRTYTRHLDPEACNVSSLELQAPFFFTVVRNPISRFISAYNTVLQLEHELRARGRFENYASCGERLEQFVDGMFGDRRLPAKRFRYDMHIASQMSALRCTSGGSQPMPLTFIRKLESLPSSDYLLSNTFLPDHRIGQANAQKGGRRQCSITSANLSHAILRQLCEYYAQDFVCLEYKLPDACLPTSGSTQVKLATGGTSLVASAMAAAQRWQG